ncbi:class I adenylate-forming enzyme family protein [Leifsonia sp. Leaf336]|uniref:class I adenylate-forming enzyme family protein n=1 Tax=Leifsonia sp. Leaf336 TaxID=1736341 RepID=UPI000ABC6D87|nr:class I adenylate-forming enzyme family protein [Leifsonia sp. Leaf336]
MTVIVPLHDDDPALLDRLASARARGDVPLVLDARRPAEQLRAAVAAASRADLDGIGWATLTSGSSGAPRIVLRTHASWAASFAPVAELLGAADAVALPAPASSSLTLFSLAHALDGGPRPLLGDVAAADGFHGTPEGLRRLLERGAAPGLRTALVGGSHLDPSLRARAEEAGIRVTAYYGAAELSFVAVDHGDGLTPFPGVELRVVDGELWVRSPFVAAGYAGADGPLRRDGAWATVGDRAVLESTVGDRGGPGGERLRLLGRADDAILSASATIVPDEVEAALRGMPGVRDAVVFGLPTGRVGALVAALIEPAGSALSLASLREAAAERLAPAHRPRRWYLGALPRTASGKPARAEAVRRVLAGEVRRLEH